MNKFNILVQLASFLIGSVPFAVVIPWLLHGIDIRIYGSHNPGTTNVYRVIKELYGKPSAMLATILVGGFDLFKGIMPSLLGGPMPQTNSILAVLGHLYSPFLGFRGGKAVATFLGAFIGVTLNPIFLLSPAIWLLSSFTDALSKIFRLETEWVNFGIFKIKQTFFASLFCMSLSMLLFFLTNQQWFIKLIYFATFIVICFQHSEHISLN